MNAATSSPARQADHILDHGRLGDLIDVDVNVFLACEPNPMHVALYLDDLRRFRARIDAAVTRVRGRFATQLAECGDEVCAPGKAG